MQRRRRQPRRSRSDASARHRGRHARRAARRRAVARRCRRRAARAQSRCAGDRLQPLVRAPALQARLSFIGSARILREQVGKASCLLLEPSSLPSAGNTTYRPALRSAALGDSSRSSTPHPQPNPPRARVHRIATPSMTIPAASVAGPRRPQGRLHSLPRGGGIVPAAPLDSALLGITRAPMSSSAAWKVPPSRKA